MDCRHGRALLYSASWEELLVWDPITGDKQYMRTPPAFTEGRCNATVVCAADDHGDCHSSPFLVVFVFTNMDDDEQATSACVYSSATGVWGGVTSAVLPTAYVQQTRASHVGNSLYFHMCNNDILEFDLETRNLELIGRVEGPREPYDQKNQILMVAADGELGVAAIERFSLRLWSREADPDRVVKWTLRKAIDLTQVLPRKVLLKWRRIDTLPDVVGFAEDGDMLYISTKYGCAAGTYRIHLKSMRCEMVLKKESFFFVYLYTSFYTAAIVDEGDDED